MKEVKGRHGGFLKVPEKGETNNPNGRPKGSRNVKTVIRELLNTELERINELTGEKGSISVVELMNIRLAKNVIDGEANAVPSYNALMDRFEGKATQAVEVGVTERTPKGFTLEGELLTPFVEDDEASEDIDETED